MGRGVLSLPFWQTSRMLLPALLARYRNALGFVFPELNTNLELGRHFLLC
jgi:hypothetical protein